MWPWGHAAAGFLLFVAIATYTGDRRTGLPVVAVLFGTQAPDLVDKPLAWTVPILPAGRSLAHSFVTTGPLLVALLVIAAVGVHHRRSRLTIAAFVLGYTTHLLTDGLYPFLNGEFEYLTYLAYPLIALPQYEASGGIISHFLALEVTGTFLFEVCLSLFAFAVWVWLRFQGSSGDTDRILPVK